MLVRFLLLAVILITINSISAQPPFVLEPGVSQTMAKWRAANYSDVRYKLNITLEKGAPVLKGTIEIRVKLSEPPASAGGLASAIILDWRKIRGREDLSTISNVSINGSELRLQPRENIASKDATLSYEEINEHLVFQDGVKVGENVIKLNFTSPIATSGAAVTRYVDREDGAEYIYSLFVPSDASTAFPVFDQPDLKARFSLKLTFPDSWRAISNTNANCYAMDPGAPVTCNFEETKPISTYVFAFAAGEFAVLSEPGAVATGLNSTNRNASLNTNDSNNLRSTNAKLNPPATAGGTDLPMKIFVRKSQAEKFKQHAAETFRLNREGVKFLESYFDFKFPFPKYDLVLIPEFPFRGMEHAGATFLREDSIIFPSEPTANDHISRANVIFHEAAHQWFGDTVTMKWFDDLWLKEGFAEFMAYKTLEKVMPEYNAWKAFYERNKPLAYATDSTRGTTPIYQEIPNLSAAKSAYGNIVYRKAPSFLRQAEFYLGEDKFQTAVRAFLKKYQFKNAEWTDLVREFEMASGKHSVISFQIEEGQEWITWGQTWVNKRGLIIVRTFWEGLNAKKLGADENSKNAQAIQFVPTDSIQDNTFGQLPVKFRVLVIFEDRSREVTNAEFFLTGRGSSIFSNKFFYDKSKIKFVFPNYQDYGYGIFLLDEKSRDYVLKNIQNEKDDFLRSMMWGALWDSVREAELAPKDYIELAIKNISIEKDELTIQTILSRVSTAMNYYLSDVHAKELAPKLENLLIDKMQNAPTLGMRITFYRAFLNTASSEKGRDVLKKILKGEFRIEGFNCRGDSCGRPMSEAKNDSPSPTILKTKDKFDIVTRLAILNDPEAEKLLEDLKKTETSDDAKRYAYAVGAAFPSKEAKGKYFSDFLNNKEISESWIESSVLPFNSARHSELTLPFLEKALAELPNLKRSRKIFFVNGWLAAFIGGQKDEKALGQVNKFLADNPNLDKDLRLKILENLDVIERAVKIRTKFGK